MALPERTKLDRVRRVERLRAGEERMARAAFQQALGTLRAAEEREALCRGAYRDIMADANRKLQGVIDVGRLPILQLMVNDARRALQAAERGRTLAATQAAAAEAKWVETKRALQVMEKAQERALGALRSTVGRREQQELDELATLRAGRP
ncbi:MAG TPA: flagellar FliJ family protein [bacterium]|nr:flagellar FliJ family protein [bacterium]